MHRTIFPDLKAVLGKVALGHTANALTDSVAEVGVLHFLTSIVYFQIYIHLPDVEFSLVLLKTQSWNSDNSHISRFLDSRIYENILLVMLCRLAPFDSGEYWVGTCTPERSCQR